jgi:hypothetical protein
MGRESLNEIYNPSVGWISDRESALMVAGLAKVIVPIPSDLTAERELMRYTQREEDNTCGVKFLTRYKCAMR